MKILCLTHADFEGPGYLQDWAKERHYDFKIVRPYQGQDCLSETDFDLLFLMGGPQSVIDLENYSYLIDEIALIQKAFYGHKHIIGFCLGTQLISAALGGQVEKSPFKEIGSFPISWVEKGKRDPLFEGFPDSFPAIHWHEDMAGLPEGALILAESDACPRQITRYDSKIYGFQCHLEMTYRCLKDFIKNCGTDIQKESRFIQNAETMLNHDFEEMNQRLALFLDRFVATIGSQIMPQKRNLSN